MHSLILGLLACVELAHATDLDIVAGRLRNAAATASLSASYSQGYNVSQVSSWLSSIQPDGSWPDIDYTTGCAATTWLAEAHWARIIGLSQAWSGLNPNADPSYANSTSVFSAATSAMDWWFQNDYNNTACLQPALSSGCPCGTPGLWNYNWYFQVIGVPTLASDACLLLYPGNLSEYQQEKCLEFGIRGSNYSSQASSYIYQTATNLVNIMQNVINAAISSDNETLLASAYNEAFVGGFSYSNITMADGVHVDGTFLQHTGEIYNGDYGVAALSAFITLQQAASGTEYQASQAIEDVLATLIEGNDWQIFTDTANDKLYWDLSTIGRFIAFPRSDGFASDGILFNVTALAEVTSGWTGAANVSPQLARLEQSSSATVLSGNKGYWASDYMVHRRSNFALFNKMISTRSRNSEYENGANPLGYHLNQGCLWTWVEGTEYQDIAGAWDWYLVPGSTVLYHYPTLNSSWMAVIGKKNYVGVVSDGQNGISVMDYVDPHDASISYRRAWFYYDDIIINYIINATIASSVTSNAPIVSVIDQRLAGSGFYVDGSASSGVSTTSAKTLLYSGTGYFAYNGEFNLTANEESMTGNWSAISTSLAGDETQDIFTAYTTMANGTTFAYAMLPDSNASTLASQAANPTYTTVNSTGIIGVAGNNRLGLTWWPNAQKNITIPYASIGWASTGGFTIQSSNPTAVMLSKSGTNLVMYVSEPTQLLTSVTFYLQSLSGGLKITCGAAIACSSTTGGIKFVWSPPTGPYAGSTSTNTFTIQ